jgi:hypothetical protein
VVLLIYIYVFVFTYEILNLPNRSIAFYSIVTMHSHLLHRFNISFNRSLFS